MARQGARRERPRSTFYYRPKPSPEGDLELMRKLDECPRQRPFSGARRLRDGLAVLGYTIKRKQVPRLMRERGRTALYPKRNLSQRTQRHTGYPDLRKGLIMDRPKPVWAAAVTYLPMAKGCLYLVAIMDGYSRKVLAWALANSLEARCCVEALETAIETYGNPESFHTDPGRPFTGAAFTSALKADDLRISRAGQGRWVDHGLVERLWRSLKYAEVYLKGYDPVAEARQSISTYLHLFNQERRHQSLHRQTPDQVDDHSASQRMAA